jgi:hypothetical protein
VTALFAEYTGTHQPLDVDWSLERGVRTTASAQRAAIEPIVEGEVPAVAAVLPAAPATAVERPNPRTRSEPRLIEPPGPLAFATFWEFAVAVNRSEPAAMALAGNGATSDIPIDGAELKKLLGMMWFRTVLARLSQDWRDRILNVLIESAVVPDHVVRLGRQAVHLRELAYEQLQEIGAKTMVPDWVRPDLDLLVTVGRFWGADAVKRFRFVDAPERHEPSMMETLLEKLRG